MTAIEARTAAKRSRHATTLLGRCVPATSASTSLPEDAIQRAIIAQWRARPVPGSIVAHIPNGERRDAVTGARLKALGVLPGMPDLLCGSLASGVFFLELKRRGGKLSPAQRRAHDMLRGIGVEVYVCDTLDGAIDVLERNGVLRRSASIQGF